MLWLIFIMRYTEALWGYGFEIEKMIFHKKNSCTPD